MPDSASKDLLARLCLAAGAPGSEDPVRRIVRESLNGTGPVEYDRLGSILCTKRGGSDQPRILLDSHLDEVGFMVQSISDEGRLAFVPLGSWWGHVLLGQRVNIISDAGPFPGLVGAKPPHFLSAAERNKVLELDKMYIDIGASDRDQVEQLGIKIGDPIVPHAEFVEMAVQGRISCKALDNRIGVALMCETLSALARESHPNTVIGAGTVQEELGARGAATVGEVARPDVGIVLECTPADDLPGFTERQALLGAGPQIRHFDPTAVSNRRLVRLVESVAEENRIPCQMAVRRSGGTDAGSLHRSRAGVPTVVIGVPARYIHTHAGLMDWQDYVAARRLILELVKRLDAGHVEELTRFD